MLELAIRSDFADLFEVKSVRLTRRLNISTDWNPHREELTTSYHHEDFHRRVVYKVTEATSSPTYANGRLVFEVRLKPMQQWDAVCTGYLLTGGRRPRNETDPAQAFHRGKGRPVTREGAELEKFQKDWLVSCTNVRTSNDHVERAYLQAIEDMGALRLPEHDVGPDVWVP